MFAKLLNFLRGYIVVSVTGFSVERFLNLAVRREVYIWDVCRKNNQTFFSCFIKDFKLLRHCSKKSCCKLRIRKKAGLPFIVHRYKKRKFLVLGLFAFIGAVVYLTSFIWLVTVDGNERVDKQALFYKLAEMGVSAGASKRDINLRDVEHSLMSEFSDLAWVNISIKGTKASLRVIETILKPEIVDADTACDVVAVKDGLIVSMATETGRPLVRPGDVVRAGDTLVSGEVIVGDDSTGYSLYSVRANSVVTAKRYYEFIFDVPLTYIIKSFTGNVTYNYGIILLEKKYYIKNIESPYACYDKTIDEHRLSFGSDYPLPATYFVEKYREFIPIVVGRSLEEAEIMGRSIVNARIKRELPEDTDVLEMDLKFAPNGDVMTVAAKVVTLESIGKVRPIETE